MGPQHDQALGRATQRKQMLVRVGRRIRSARESAGISQADLGQALGVTFQQIQKYELGSNAVSAAMLLYQIAVLLDRDMSYFFEHAPALDLH